MAVRQRQRLVSGSGLPPRRTLARRLFYHHPTIRRRQRGPQLHQPQRERPAKRQQQHVLYLRTLPPPTTASTGARRATRTPGAAAARARPSASASDNLTFAHALRDRYLRRGRRQRPPTRPPTTTTKMPSSTTTARGKTSGGSGSFTASGSQSWSLSGSGGYDTSLYGNSASGTLSTNGSGSDSYQYTQDYDFCADGQWRPSGGGGGSSGSGSITAGYMASGGYSVSIRPAPSRRARFPPPSRWPAPGAAARRPPRATQRLRLLHQLRVLGRRLGRTRAGLRQQFGLERLQLLRQFALHSPPATTATARRLRSPERPRAAAATVPATALRKRPRCRRTALGARPSRGGLCLRGFQRRLVRLGSGSYAKSQDGGAVSGTLRRRGTNRFPWTLAPTPCMRQTKAGVGRAGSVGARPVSTICIGLGRRNGEFVQPGGSRRDHVCGLHQFRLEFGRTWRPERHEQLLRRADPERHGLGARSQFVLSQQCGTRLHLRCQRLQQRDDRQCGA